MKTFKPIGEGQNAAYYITADQKDDFFTFIRQKLAENNNSKKGIVTKTFLDGDEQMIRNKGTTEKPVFNFTNKSKTDKSTQARIDAEEFSNDASKKASAAWKKKNITDWNNGSNPTGKKLVKGTPAYNKYFRRYEHKLKLRDPIWKSLDIAYKSGDVENLTWTYPAQWRLKDAGEMKYGKDFIFDIEEITGDVQYTPRKGFDPLDPHSSIFKKFTGVIDHTSNLIPTPVKKLAKGAAATGIVGLGLIDDVSASVKPFVTDYDGNEEQRKIDEMRAAAGWTGLYATATGNIPAASMSMLGWSAATYKGWALGKDKGRIDDLELSLGLKSSDRNRLEPDVLGQGDTQKLTRRGSR